MTPTEALQAILDPEHAIGITAHRKALRKPLTLMAAQLLAKRLALFADPNRAAEVIIERAWLSIEPDWRHGLQLASEIKLGSLAVPDRIKIEMSDPSWSMFPSAFQGKDGSRWVAQSDLRRYTAGDDDTGEA